MSPLSIVKAAVERGVNALALTDHNSAGNCAAMAKLCRDHNILFFPGLEVTTAEEAHVLCLFGEVETAAELGKIIYESLPDIKNVPEKFGDQIYVNENDEVEDFEEKFLGMASSYSIDHLREKVLALGGLFIASHVDKPVFSVISQLGFLSGFFSAAEISSHGAQREDARALAGAYTAVSASDSHYLHTIANTCVQFELSSPSIEEYRAALERKQVEIIIAPS
ncbi:MAG: histidinol-phosphatase [Chitinispirillia bacterium]|nr:histidinol-phosphatase [Chitinispirillia bacterium]